MYILLVGNVLARRLFQGLLGVADRLAPRERVQNIQALAEALLESNGETVVIVDTHRIDPSDGAKALDRPPRLHRQGAAGSIRAGLVVITDNRQPRTVISVVGDLDHRVLQDLSLHGNHPRLNPRPARVSRNVI